MDYFSLKKKWTIDTYSNMDEYQIILSERSWTKKSLYCMNPFVYNFKEWKLNIQ